MNTKIIFAFSIGAAVGSVVTWKLVKTKYEQIAQEEIDSVKEVYSIRVEEGKDVAETAPVYEPEKEEGDTPIETDISKYKNLTSNYVNYSNVEKGGSESMEDLKPYVIPPQLLGDEEDYDVVTLNYYQDGVLTYDTGEVIEDADDIVGEESLGSFGEYEDDSVCVRNDKYKTYYEILLHYDECPNPTVNE